MLMNAILPSALVEHYEQFIEQVNIPDRDDRHVVAAAIASGAQKILTWNLGDFPNKILKIFGVQAESPDAFIYSLLLDAPQDVVKIFKTFVLDSKRHQCLSMNFLSACKEIISSSLRVIWEDLEICCYYSAVQVDRVSRRRYPPPPWQRWGWLAFVVNDLHCRQRVRPQAHV